MDTNNRDKAIAELKGQHSGLSERLATHNSEAFAASVLLSAVGHEIERLENEPVIGPKKGPASPQGLATACGNSKYWDSDECLALQFAAGIPDEEIDGARSESDCKKVTLAAAEKLGVKVVMRRAGTSKPKIRSL
jgi:hypothetical protein